MKKIQYLWGIDALRSSGPNDAFILSIYCQLRATRTWDNVSKHFQKFLGTCNDRNTAPALSWFLIPPEAWPCPWEAVMGPDAGNAPSLSLSPADACCSPLIYLSGPVYSVLWGTVGKGGCPWSSLSGKEAVMEQIIISDECFWRECTGHHRNAEWEVLIESAGGGSFPEEMVFSPPYWRGSRN